MKKVFTLAISLLLTSSIFATAEFFLKVNLRGNYTVSLNNQTMTSTSNIFRFFDLYSGYYRLKIYQNGYGNRLLVNRNIDIREGNRTVAEVDAYGTVRIIDRIPFVQSTWYIDNLLSSLPNCGIPAPNQPGSPIPPCTHGQNTPCNSPHHGAQQDCPPSNYPYGGYGYNGNLLDDAGLQSLIQTMKHVTFEEKMLDVAKTALKDKQVNTQQIHQLLSQFTFEKNKLDLAKYCFDKTVDKNNYYTLYNDFTFSSYSTELDKYINSR
jgi:hypothetical protein